MRRCGKEYRARVDAKVSAQLLDGFRTKFGLNLSKVQSTIADTLSFERQDGLNFTDHQRIWIEAWSQGCIVGVTVTLEEVQS